jgi:putative transposase
VDTHSQTIDFRLTEPRDARAATRCLTQAIHRHGVPDTMTIDGSEANDVAIRSDKKAHGTTIDIRQITYRNNVIEQDHRRVKRVTRPMVGFNAVEAAPSTRVGLELMHMRRTGQISDGVEQGLTPAEPFDALASEAPHRRGLFPSHRVPPTMATAPPRPPLPGAPPTRY